MPFQDIAKYDILQENVLRNTPNRIIYYVNVTLRLFYINDGRILMFLGRYKLFELQAIIKINKPKYLTAGIFLHQTISSNLSLCVRSIMIYKFF